MIKSLSLFLVVSLFMIICVKGGEIKGTGNNQSRSNLAGIQANNSTEILPFPLELKQSAILWSKLSNNPITIEEKLSMLEKNLGALDEFTRKKVMAQADKEFLDVQMELEKAESFKFTIVKELGEYDFSRQGFPIDLQSDYVLVEIGTFEDPVTTSMVGVDMIIYYAKTDVPSGLDFIELKEKDAEKLAKSLQESRNIQVEFTANVKNWIPSLTTEQMLGKKKNRGLLFETSSVKVTLEFGNQVLKVVKSSALANQPKEIQ